MDKERWREYYWEHCGDNYGAAESMKYETEPPARELTESVESLEGVDFNECKHIDA